MNTRAHLFFGQTPLFEEFFQQRIVRFGNVFDQFLVESLDFRCPFASRRDLFEFPAPIRSVRDDFAPQHIQNLVESRARIHRNRHRKHALAQSLFHLSQNDVKVSLFFVHRVNDDHLRDSVMGRIIPDLLGADGNSVIGVNDD